LVLLDEALAIWLWIGWGFCWGLEIGRILGVALQGEVTDCFRTGVYRFDIFFISELHIFKRIFHDDKIIYTPASLSLNNVTPFPT
jgi:hypothetical protein